MAGPRRSLVLIAVTASVAVLGLLPAQTASATSRDNAGHLVVRTDKGLVRGVRADGVDSFLGIPYAAPPVGQLRWKPPQPAAAWHGVKLVDRYGNWCPQAASEFAARSEVEDCLFVNVQRPADVSKGDNRPVYVFIHGGGLLIGSSNLFDGAPMVAATGVMVVTLNYRLGVFGFLGHPALTREAGESGNYGFMDQQAALRWIQRNIAAFGGDPRRVTIGGQSAGGWSVCAHLVAPASRGLFARAMIQSGACPSETQGETEAFGDAAAQQVGCTTAATVLACLRGTPTDKLLDATPGIMLFTRGTSVLPDDPRVAIGDGAFAHVPVVIGANRDEGRSFVYGVNFDWSKQQYIAAVRQDFGPVADAVLAHYPWPARSDRFTAAYLLGAILTDSGGLLGLWGCPNRQLTQDLARSTRTYAYEFDHRTGPGQLPDSTGFEWGAGHGAELAYLFPSFSNGAIAPTFNAGERRLATEMKRYWGAFVRRGAPHVSGQTAWPRYDTTRLVLSLRAGGHSVLISDKTLGAEHQCAFWDALFAGAAGQGLSNHQVAGSAYAVGLGSAKLEFHLPGPPRRR